MEQQHLLQEDVAQEFYLDFAEGVFARLKLWVTEHTDEVPYCETIIPFFGDHGVAQVTQLQALDYDALVGRWQSDDSEWFWLESKRGIDLEIANGNISWDDTIMDDEDGSIRKATAEESATIREQIVEFHINHVYTQPILSVLNREKKLDFAREKIKTEYLIFRGNWQGTDNEWKVTMPLLNLVSDFLSALDTSTAVGGIMTLAPFSSKHKSELWGESCERYADDSINLSELQSAKIALSGSFNFGGKSPRDMPIEDSPELKGVVAEAQRFVTSLRLLKPGDVGLSISLAENKFHPHQFGALPVPVPASHKVRCRYGHDYSLDSEDFAKVLALMSQLNQGAERDLSVALRRFNQSYDRDNSEDAIIDLVVALESCLLADNEDQTQLQYKLSLRGAALLAPLLPPQKTQLQLKALYNARSKIVHAGKSLIDKEVKEPFAKLEPTVDVREIVAFSQSTTRKVLLEYVSRLNEGTPLQNVNKELDAKILNSLAIPSSAPQQE